MKISVELQQRLESFARVSSGVVMALALAAMAGWFFDVGVLKTVRPGAVSMKFNTAAGLLLCGLALWGATRRGQSWWRGLGRVGAGLVVALGGATLTEYASGWSSGLESLLLDARHDVNGGAYAGRMSPHSATSFLLFGLAFLFSADGGWRRTVSRVLLVLLAMIALTALAGHMYSAVPFYGLSRLTGMAIHTATGFMLLAAGLYGAQHVSGGRTIFFSNTAGGISARRLLAAAVIVPLALGWLVELGEQAGYFDSATESALLVVPTILLLAVLIAINARQMHHHELARRQTMEERERTIEELTKALNEVSTLRGLLPMCGWCKKVRNDAGYWSDVAAYINHHTEAKVSHGICPDCASVHFDRTA